MRDIADLRHILSSSIDCIDDVLPPRKTEGEKKNDGLPPRNTEGEKKMMCYRLETQRVKRLREDGKGEI